MPTGFLNAMVNTKKCDTWINNKVNDSGNLLAKVNNSVSLPMFRNLQMTAPVFRGYMRRNMMMEVLNGKNVSTTWIRFPTFDPDRGHPYAYFAEFGRPAISGKLMRYYRSPSAIGAGTMGAAQKGNLIFTRRVGGADPSFFIRNTITLFKGVNQGIASKQVGIWLKT